MLTFKKGVEPGECKLTASMPITAAPVPKKVIIPLQQHIGVPCEPLVKVGDKVGLYQKIASSDGLSAPIHATVSGKVSDIALYPSPVGAEVKSIVIEKTDDPEKELEERQGVETLTVEGLLEIVKEAGIVGLGGAAFPTHVKLKPQKPVDTLIVNGSECEPFLTNDHRLMLEDAEEIVKGILIEMKILGVQKAYIGIEENKADAVLSMQKVLHDKRVEVVKLKTKYPQGAEKILIKTILKRECAHSKLPTDVGVVVSNVGTAKAIYDAVYYGKPLIERVVTITGDVKKPQNILVRLGTPIKELLSFCEAKDPKKIVIGGPMMGVAQYTDEVPVIKSTTGIVVFEDVDDEKTMHCIRCGYCIDVCPYNLVPTTIAKASEKGKFELAELYHALECMECGCCAYICPARIPLVQHIRVAKAEIMKRKKK